MQNYLSDNPFTRLEDPNPFLNTHPRITFANDLQLHNTAFNYNQPQNKNTNASDFQNNLKSIKGMPENRDELTEYMTSLQSSKPIEENETKLQNGWKKTEANKLRQRKCSSSDW